MAKQNMLPRRISKILTSMEKQNTKHSMCNDCCGAKATRKPWRSKGDKTRQSHIKKVNQKRRTTRRSHFIIQCMANEEKKKTIHRRNLKMQSLIVLFLLKMNNMCLVR